MKKLQRRFIAITTLAITAVMLVLLLVLNLYNYGATYSEAYRILRFIAENEGEIGMPDAPVSVNRSYRDNEEESVPKPKSSKLSDARNALQGIFGYTTLDLTGENSYMIRYYSVIFDADRNVSAVNIRHFASIDKEAAASRATELLSRTIHHGHFTDDSHTYTFINSRTQNKGRIVVVMDSTKDLADAASVIHRSFMLGVLCLIIFVIIVVFLSKKAISPLMRNMENQKAFITNAGHELKTPLAVIKADTEVLEMTVGSNEWTRSISSQVDRLTVLVGNLITLAKMGELKKEALTDVDFSECVRTAADNYKTVISNQGKHLDTDITDGVHIRGIKDGLTEIANILLDNAQKYCDEGGTIRVSLTRTRKSSGAKLVISNDYAAGKDTDYTKFFDRFYRADTSHNSGKNDNSGYGIGLSMAEGFAEEFGGKIAADWSDGRISFIVLF